MGNLLTLCTVRNSGGTPRELQELNRLDGTKELVELWVTGLEKEARRLRQQAKAQFLAGSKVMAKQSLKAAIARERLATKQADCISKLDLMRLSLEGLVGARDILATLNSGSKAALDIQKQLEGFDKVMEQVEDSVEQATQTMTALSNSEGVESAAGFQFDPDELEAELAQLVADEQRAVRPVPLMPSVPTLAPEAAPTTTAAPPKQTAEGVLI